MVESIKLYVGVEAKQWLASEVLRFSILRRTKASIEYNELSHLPFALAALHAEKPLYRFAIPELCQYHGKAIFLTADSLVLSDILELFQLDMQGYGALARLMHGDDPIGPRYTNVMLLDNSRLRHWKLSEWMSHIASDREIYRDTLTAGPKGLATQDFGPLPKSFNEQDFYDASTKIVHFAHLPTQPWKYPGHPQGSLFLRELKAALEADEIPLEALLREIRHGHLYPSILEDLAKI